MKFIQAYRYFSNKFERVITNKSQGTYLYGHGDNLPQRLIEMIANNGVAKRSVKKLSRYIAGDGFSNELSAELKVNMKGWTADKLLSMVASQTAWFEGMALLVRRKRDGSIGTVEPLQFENVRLKDNDTEVVYNKKCGTKDYKKSEDIIYPIYTKPFLSAIEMQQFEKNYNSRGEVLYVFNQDVLNVKYPIPDYYAAEYDIKSSTEFSLFDYENVYNGFWPSALLTIIGDIDDQTEDDKGKTQAYYLKEKLKEFTGKEKDKEGLSGRASLLVLNAATKDEIPTLQQLDMKAVLEGSVTKRDQVDRIVSRAFGIHPVLNGFSDAAVLGNTQAISNAITELNNNVNSFQRMITEAFTSIWPNNDWTISQFNPIQYIPEEVWATLTDDEKRNIAGFEPMPEIEDTGITGLAATVGGLNAIIEMQKAVGLNELDPKSARAAVRILFNFSEVQAADLFPEVQND
jgi:hypothetical protein